MRRSGSLSEAVMNKTVIIGERYKNAFSAALSAYFEDIIFLPDNPHVAPALAGHFDLSVFKTADNKLICASYLKGTRFENELHNREVDLIFDTAEQKSDYPMDCALNAMQAGKYLICNSEICSERITDACKGSTVINVKQGYVRCSVLHVAGNNYITADNGIASALTKAGCDVLMISTGGIELPGYDYGFIGGASFVCDNRVFFMGSINTHPDCAKILGFIEHCGMQTVSLGNGKLLDTGGAVVVY